MEMCLKILLLTDLLIHGTGSVQLYILIGSVVFCINRRNQTCWGSKMSTLLYLYFTGRSPRHRSITG